MWPRRLIELADELPAPTEPAAVVWPETVEHVVGLVQAARTHGFGLVPFGAGSGVCAGVAPEATQVVVDLKRFVGHGIEPGPTLRVGAGVMGITLEEDLLRAGHTTGHYPSSILCSTVGGWVAARGAGQCSGRYGKIEDMVTWIELVLGTGEAIVAHRRELGPNLLPLIVGSEGTLGIITRVGLRLHAAPSERAFLAFAFDDVAAGIGALRALYQAGLRPAVARLYDPLDTLTMKTNDEERATPESPRANVSKGSALLRAFLGHPALVSRALAAVENLFYSRAGLVLVLEGNDSSVSEDARRARAICQALGGADLGEGPARAWLRNRYHVSYRQPPMFRSGLFVDTMEVSASWSRLHAVYDSVRRALAQHVLVMAHFSHSYPDGASIYFTFAGTEHGPHSARQLYDLVWRDALTAALGAGATLSHHHGVGRSKAALLGAELGSGLHLLRAVKSAWDPNGILNPGALSPPMNEADWRPLPDLPAQPELDEDSELVHSPASLRLGQLEDWLGARGRTLDLNQLAQQREKTIDQWLGEGMPGVGDHFADPVATRIAGFSAQLNNGRRIAQHPAPRRAVGPDLASLFVGMGGAHGRFEAALLAAPRVGAPRTRPFRFDGERSPAVTDGEQRAMAALSSALERA